MSDINVDPKELIDQLSSRKAEIVPRIAGNKFVGTSIVQTNFGRPEHVHLSQFHLDEIPDDGVEESIDMAMLNISRANCNHREYDAVKLSNDIANMYGIQKNIDPLPIPVKLVYPKLNHDIEVGMEAAKKVFENNGKCISQPDVTCICDNFIQTGQCLCGIFENIDVKYHKYDPFMSQVYTPDDEEDD